MTSVPEANRHEREKVNAAAHLVTTQRGFCPCSSMITSYAPTSRAAPITRAILPWVILATRRGTKRTFSEIIDHSIPFAIRAKPISSSTVWMASVKLLKRTFHRFHVAGPND
jgi:hypothetical protein